MVAEDHRAEAAGDGRLRTTRWGAIWAVFGAGMICGAYMTKVAPAPPLQRVELGLWAAYMPAGGGIASLRLLAESLARPGNIALAVLFAFYVSQWVSVMIWLPTFLVDERGASPTAAALLTALMVPVNAPRNIAGGWLLAHGVRRGPMVIAASAIMAVCSAGMLGPLLPDGLRYLLCLAFSACAGVIPGAIFSGLPAHAKTPQHIGTANGMVMQTSQAGQFVGPIALAWLASHYGGWGATLWAMLVFAAGGALCGLALTRIERDKMAR